MCCEFVPKYTDGYVRVWRSARSAAGRKEMGALASNSLPSAPPIGGESRGADKSLTSHVQSQELEVNSTSNRSRQSTERVQFTLLILLIL